MPDTLKIGLPLLAVFGSLCGFFIWQLVSRLRSLASGIAAEGRCVRCYSTENTDRETVWHHVYGFTTREGQYVEFEEDAMLMEVGQVVTIHYRSANPASSATTVGIEGTWSPLIINIFSILILGFFALMGVMMVWDGISNL
ncbi:DUF3592 domain-containing protein [Streptomyces sp. NPDC001678]|uniref:DUF3592 domain-containing protein n=1 Tax=Streptomyces sp. NPDC001678 TaxID=3364599 RepID=UPI0036B78130